MTWLCRALPNNFIASSERIACAAGIIFVPGNLASASILSRGILARYGRNRNRPPTFVRNVRSDRSSFPASATSAALGRVVAGRSSSRETSESLLLENRRDRGRTQLFPTLIQGIPDVVHRRVLLAQGDDLLTKSLPGRRQLGLLRLWQKELSLRVFAELMAQDAKTPGCVAEPLGRLC